MTEEQKDLLIKDLFTRIPYDVKVNCNDKTYNICGIQGFNICWLSNENNVNALTTAGVKYLKPYLFPLSSMTEEQRKEYDSIIYYNVELHADRYYEVIDVDSFELLHDFYHKNHLDYRGLIPMGLAIDCTNLNVY